MEVVATRLLPWSDLAMKVFYFIDDRSIAHFRERTEWSLADR